MIEQLASLLLPIEALLSHEDFDPQSKAAPELVGLFRTMWFLCSLFHFAMFEEKDQIAMNWVRQVLGKIASKTPAIVVEEAMDLVGELEYNTVIRREYAYTVSLFGITSSLCSSELLVWTGDFKTQRNIGKAHTSSVFRDSVSEQQPSRVPTNHARPRELQVRSRPSVIVAFILHGHRFE